MSSVAPAVARPRGVSNRTLATIRHGSLRGAALVYLFAMVALPVSAVVTKGFGSGISSLIDAMHTPGATGAIRLTLITSGITAIVNAVMGTLIAYVLVRFRFPGRGLLSAIVDLPLAIPTLVTGVALLALYGPNAPVGSFLGNVGVHVAFAPLGIMFALLVVTLPFVVRTVQPVLLEIDPAEEEAASTLGAGGWTTFRRIVLPALRPAIAAGTLLSFARALGEFGSIVILSGNIPNRTLTAPVLIYQLSAQFKPEQAAAVATLLFAISFALVMVTTRLIRTRTEDSE